MHTAVFDVHDPPLSGEIKLPHDGSPPRDIVGEKGRTGRSYSQAYGRLRQGVREVPVHQQTGSSLRTTGVLIVGGCEGLLHLGQPPSRGTGKKWTSSYLTAIHPTR